MMKRRNLDNAKIRRNIKRGRLGDNVFSGSLVYVKLFFAWALLLMADFLLGFRFEYLWPFWLLMRSIYDSFRYQGLAFSVFFVCVTVTSDLVCFLFIPVQWLFVLASTYVWLQYVWHADRGVCFPTVTLCLLFVCFEASVRLKELTSKGGVFPFTLDLCRPFAAHCIGYPVVTLGFGVKSYVGYKYRLRKQREIARENEIYAQTLTESLPAVWYGPADTNPDLQIQRYQPCRLSEDAISNTTTTTSGGANQQATGAASNGVPAGGGGKTGTNESGSVWSRCSNGKLWTQQGSESSSWLDLIKCRLLGVSNQSQSGSGTSGAGSSGGTYSGADNSQLINVQNPLGGWFGQSGRSDRHNIDAADSDEDTNLAAEEYDDADSSRGSSVGGKHDTNKHNRPDVTTQSTTTSGSKRSTTRGTQRGAGAANSSGSRANRRTGQSSTTTTYVTPTPTAGGGPKGDGTSNQYSTSVGQSADYEQMNGQIDGEKETLAGLEIEFEKLKTDLRNSRLIESELRSQIQHLNNVDKATRGEMQQLRTKNDSLETKLSNLTRSRELEKASIQTLEKRLIDEQRQRTQLETQIEKERKANKKAEEQRQNASEKKVEQCGDACRQRRRDVENELKQLRRDLRSRDDQLQQLEQELSTLRQYKEAHNMEVLMSALATMKEKNAHLEKSLSAENRLKQDLFSALGEAKHQIDAIKGELQRKELEIESLRSHMSTPVSGAGPTLTPPPPAPMSAQDVNEPNVDLLTSAIYNGVAAYLNNNTLSASGTSGGGSSPVVSTASGVPPAPGPTGDSDRFEDAVSSVDGLMRHALSTASYTPPRTQQQ